MSIRIASFTSGLREFNERLAPDAMRRELAAFARSELAKAIGAGAASPSYRRYVNGREGAQEEEVRLPGPILYVFAPTREAVEFALQFLKERWPVRGPAAGGHFVDSWIVLVNGSRWDGQSDIPAGAEAVIVNTQPYARKAQVGAKGFSIPRGMVEDARQAVLKKWRLPLDAQIRFIQLAGGYVLKGRRPVRQAQANRRSSAFRQGRTTLAHRKDTNAGTAMKYPALVIAPRVD